jgi:hypothetical protein
MYIPFVKSRQEIMRTAAETRRKALQGAVGCLLLIGFPRQPMEPGADQNKGLP